MKERFYNSRGAGFAAITAVYVLAAALGIGLYRVLPGSWWLRLLLADIAATVLTFIFSVVLGNASVYDPYWSVQPLVILAALQCGQRLSLLRVLLLAAVFLWGIRLTANWAYTFHGLAHQDWRYTMLHQKTGVFYPFVNFTGIHMVPTLIVYLCTLPAAYAVLNPAALPPLSLAGIALSLAAVILQGTADVQMHRFRRQKSGGFIRIGLWKYSRHPNYLGEILMWWGIAAAVAAAFPTQWHLCAGAAANTLLFLAVSIPMADKRQSAKSGYAEYAAATRMLLPLKKRRA